MANWVYNRIMVYGEARYINKISSIIKDLKEDDYSLFQSLIGLPEDMDIESYNDLTSDDSCRFNLDWFGVNSDEDLNFVEEINDNLIIFSGETPWNPPINFCVELAKLYNVNVDMYYEEPDRDSCGKCWINSNGTSFEEEYQYLEGIYHFNGFESWYEKTWGFLSKYLLDRLCKEDNSDLQEMISDCFLFLNEEEVEKLSIELEELYETFTVRES